MRRLLLIPFGLLVGFLVLELGLQAAALFVGAPARRLPASWLTGNRRVICLGDSNTYGVYLRDRSKAYPQQLEALWNERVGSPRIEVLNLGYPGTNSSRLRRDFRRMLEVFTPEIAIVMVGANDYWTAPVAIEEPRGLRARAAEALARWSRTYELVHMLRRALSNSRLELDQSAPRQDGGDATFRYGGETFDVGWQKSGGTSSAFGEPLAENLRALARDADDAGVRLVLMTYASRMWNYGDASAYLRRVAREQRIQLVDLAAAFDPLCPKEPCPGVLVADHHPNADGYRLIAETLVAELRDVLQGRGEGRGARGEMPEIGNNTDS